MRRTRRKSRMVEISLSGSGEGLGWETGRGYSTRFSIGRLLVERGRNRRASQRSGARWRLVDGERARLHG
jgi:hypothetical protein